MHKVFTLNLTLTQMRNVFKLDLLFRLFVRFAHRRSQSLSHFVSVQTNLRFVTRSFVLFKFFRGLCTTWGSAAAAASSHKFHPIDLFDSCQLGKWKMNVNAVESPLRQTEREIRNLCSTTRRFRETSRSFVGWIVPRTDDDLSFLNAIRMNEIALLNTADGVVVFRYEEKLN